MNIEEQIKIVKNMLLHAETQLLDYEAIAIETLLTAYEKEKETSHYIQSQLDIANAKLVEEKEKNKKAKEFIQENSHEFNCKRDDLIELEFDDNTNATDLIDILDGNW